MRCINFDQWYSLHFICVEAPNFQSVICKIDRDVSSLDVCAVNHYFSG